LIIRKNSNEIF